MRKKFLGAALALVSVTAMVGFAGTAFAANDSTLDAEWNPDSASATLFTKGGLFAELTTVVATTGGTPTNPTQQPVPTSTVNLDLDNSILISPGQVPECTANLSGTTIQAALKLCGNSQIGGGTATLCAGGGAGNPCSYTTDNVFQGVVTAFNAPRDASNRPQIMLHGRNDESGQTVVLTGFLRNSPNVTADYGKRLVTPVPLILGGAASITDFSVNVTNGFFARIKCDDANTTWNYSAQFIYQPGEPSDTETDTQACTAT
jgi:hypothetical protein